MFGENILSVSPIDWVIENGTFKNGIIKLQDNGYATQALNQDDLLSIPSELYVSIVASLYTNSQEPTAFVVIKIQSTTGTQFEYSVPLIDTGNGYCVITLPTTQTSYTALSFTIRTQTKMDITSWILSAPVVDQSILDDVRQEIPRILDDYNTSLFTVGQEEVTIGFITADLLEKTDLNGHVLISYISKISCTLTIRIKDNTITELYTPVIYNIVPGRNSIGIPHAYLKKFMGIHTFIVTAQVDRDTITLFTRGLLYTIDGAYLAKRLMDIDTEITDMTIMQLVTDSEPSKIFAVGLEDGMARVRHRPIKGGSGVVWEPSYEVGPATDARIEFDGDWITRLGTAGYTLITETIPWIAWITPDKTLYVQKGLDVNTLQALAINVDKLSMVRGYKSDQVAENDQGLIIFYIREQTVYYRNYCNQVIGGTLWELERQLEEAGTDVTNVHVGRLNDYRLCVSISAPSSNKLFITPRTYVGQAFKADNPQILGAFVNSPIIEEVTIYNPIHEEEVLIVTSAVSFQYSLPTEAHAVMPLIIADELYENDNRMFSAQFNRTFYGIETINPTTVNVLPANTLLSIEDLGNSYVKFNMANPIDTSKSFKLTFGGHITAGFIDRGPVWFGTNSWSISRLPPKPPMDEEAVALDAYITGFRFDEVIPLSGILRSEEVVANDAFVSAVTITPIGTDPI